MAVPEYKAPDGVPPEKLLSVLLDIIKTEDALTKLTMKASLKLAEKELGLETGVLYIKNKLWADQMVVAALDQLRVDEPDIMSNYTKAKSQPKPAAEPAAAARKEKASPAAAAKASKPAAKKASPKKGSTSAPKPSDSPDKEKATRTRRVTALQAYTAEMKPKVQQENPTFKPADVQQKVRAAWKEAMKDAAVLAKYTALAKEQEDAKRKADEISSAPEAPAAAAEQPAKRARKADPKKAAPSKDKEVKAEKPARKRKALDFFKADADNKAAAVAELGLPKYDAAKVPNHLYTKFKSLSEAEKAKWIALETADAARWEADMKKFGGSAQK
eukprot:TRINITY_DN24189_c0_g1_i2.p1 TRINITY_DN24189_c0_g1~~TRINITY_DN24189_c0_g1_i2.p1  ORF type:complete len:330 (+),score=133.95 TRINITY_DN24189_c0_g1_i2:152-1141(+)